MTTEGLEFSPDWSVPPGETLKEILDDLGMSQAELALRLNRPKKLVNEIVQGKSAITAETAIQLERVVGLKAAFWLKLEQNYREALARQQDRETLSRQVQWLESVPVRALLDRGWISRQNDPTDQLKAVLDFFGCASPPAVETYCQDLQVSFRMSTKFKSDPMATAAWLRRGELQAQELDCQPYDGRKFRRALNSIRLLTTSGPEEFYPEAQRLCRESGVAFVITEEIPGTRVNGAARWLTSDEALIQLSLRYRWNDIFWFSFFHEAGHILLHAKKRTVFLDEEAEADEEESQADTFAVEQLISGGAWRSFIRQQVFNTVSVQRFASEQGLHPGIIVGRLQHEGLITHAQLNGLKARFRWVNA